MMRAPSLDAISAAELRVAQSARHARDSLRDVRVALRAALVRPATLAVTAGAAGLLGFWLARRSRGAARSNDDTETKNDSTGSVVLAFALRYAMQHLPFILRRISEARRSRADPPQRLSTEPIDAET